jgi:hypothetical protein
MISHLHETRRRMAAGLGQMPEEDTMAVVLVVEKRLEEGVVATGQEGADLAETADVALGQRLAADIVGVAGGRIRSRLGRKRRPRLIINRDVNMNPVGGRKIIHLALEAQNTVVDHFEGHLLSTRLHPHVHKVGQGDQGLTILPQPLEMNVQVGRKAKVADVRHQEGKLTRSAENLAPLTIAERGRSGTRKDGRVRAVGVIRDRRGSVPDGGTNPTTRDDHRLDGELTDVQGGEAEDTGALTDGRKVLFEALGHERLQNQSLQISQAETT